MNDLEMWEKQKKVLIMTRDNTRRVLNDKDIVRAMKTKYPTIETRLIAMHKLPFLEQVKKKKAIPISIFLALPLQGRHPVPTLCFVCA